MLQILSGIASVMLLTPCAAAEKPIASFRGSEFAGGAAEVFGGSKHGETGVNYVYAQPSGPRSSMRATFQLSGPPAQPVEIFLYGRDNDAGQPCPIEIQLNGKTIYQGPAQHPRDAWAWKRYAIPEGTLKAGHNEIAIVNRAADGRLGSPPWFMLAQCRIASPKHDPEAPPSIEESFCVRLPKERRPMPEPLADPAAGPGFNLRGTKGWNWTPEQYLSEIPVLARYKMNFLMNCYLSMFDVEHFAWSSGKANRWWEPLPDSKKQQYERVVWACQGQGVQFCFCMNPNLASSRPLDYASDRDIDALFQHYAWMQDLRVKWFSICLDDISSGIDAKGQARAVNEMLRRLRARDPEAQIIFCPTYYSGTGDDLKAAEYLGILATELDNDAFVFWTGDGVVGRITRAAAEACRNRIVHRLIIWDNYPVNDGSPTIHLGPVTGRDPDLRTVAYGYMCNPLSPQNEINRIPLLTIADYAYNPAGYDPARSIGQAILQLADTPEQAEALKDLVELYPGMLLFQQGTGFNPVLSRFNDLVKLPHSRMLAEMYVRHAQDVADRLAKAFPDRFKDGQAVLAADIGKLKAMLAKKYGP